MNPVLEEILRTRLVKTGDGSATELHSHISADQGAFLQELIRDRQPTTTLEIGLAFGVSALFICDALAGTPGARHIVVDPGQSADPWRGGGITSLRTAGFGDMVEFHELHSHILLADLEAAGRHVDFVFIDGAHLFDYALVDFVLADRLLNNGGIVVFDDLWMPSVQRLCRYVLTNRAYTVYRRFPDSGAQSRPSIKRRVLARIARSSKRLGALLKAEYSDASIGLALGLPRQAIALRKVRSDDRPWEYDRDF